MAFKLYFPQPPEENIMLSAAVTLTPLIIFSPWRPMIPYAIMLVGLDAFNGLDSN
jgi:hypothetical protein